MTGLLSSKQYKHHEECPHCGLFHEGKSYVDKATAAANSQLYVRHCMEKRKLLRLPDEKPHLLANRPDIHGEAVS